VLWASVYVPHATRAADHPLNVVDQTPSKKDKNNNDEQ
jgi:hypothetical protein